MIDKLKFAYFSFQGRINRSKYWGYSILFLPWLLLGALLDVIAGGSTGRVYLLFALLMAVPSIALNVKRAHDRNRNGWFVLILFIPFIGLWPMIEFGFLPGTSGPNKYGPDPLASDSSVP